MRVGEVADPLSALHLARSRPDFLTRSGKRLGLGLLEAVSEETLMQVAQAQQRIGYGGRLNRVWDEQAQAHRPAEIDLEAAHPGRRIAVAQLADRLHRAGQGRGQGVTP